MLERAGWDVERDGLAGAPPIRVFVGGKRHVTIDRALRLLGLGSESAVTAARRTTRAGCARARSQKRWRALDGPAIVCAQVGEVNTGAVDPSPRSPTLRGGAARGCTSTARSACGRRRRRRTGTSIAGVERADSWATDAHKWLNVPYDCGLAFVAHPEPHRQAMRLTAEYLVADEKVTRDAMDWTPEFSRRARGFAVYAALRSLGRSGVAELVERCCRHARTLRARSSRGSPAARC